MECWDVNHIKYKYIIFFTKRQLQEKRIQKINIRLNFNTFDESNPDSYQIDNQIHSAMKIRLFWFALTLSAVLISTTTPVLEVCLNLPVQPFNYANITLPFYLQLPQLQDADNTPPDNPVTNAGATLGRVLFYDPQLSATNTLSCASCHQQHLGFSDDSPFSRGFEGGFTGRNSMGLSMARFYANGHFFWDERAATLEAQTLMPIQDPVEMGLSLEEMEIKLSGLDYYPPLFQAAFGDPEPTSARVALALSQFIRSMVTFRSKFDQGRQATPGPPNTPFVNFTPEENLGKAIFLDPARGNCVVCHGTDAFIAPEPKNNGIDLISQDSGLYHTTLDPADIGLFKTPSLRNIELTAPFMHDGRFETLEEVINHYNNGVRNHINLSPQLRQGPNGPPRVLNLNPNERAALAAFLRTLTDFEFINDARWSDPFCESPTAVFDPETEILASVYPNPASGQVNISLGQEISGPIQVRLLDTAGQVLRQQTFTGRDWGLEQGDLPAGLYLLEIRAEGKRSVARVVWR